VDRGTPTKCKECGSTELQQDPDVLDTWFSSGLWPFSTLGWPEETPDMKRFYPTDVLETGYDILFFWVARMIMMGLWFTDDIPFHTVYLHGLVRDKNGEKMSKTKGNVIDPLVTIDEVGADTLRYTLLTGGTPGNDQNLDPEKIIYNRNFGNKLWQMSRFVITNLGDDHFLRAPDPASLDLPSRWILSRLSALVSSVQRLFDTYQYGEAGRQIKDFLWDEFADWYVEISKNALYGKDDAAKRRTREVLVHVIQTSLRLLHPFMPFITEDIWRYLPGDRTSLIITPWPTVEERYIDPKAEAEMDLLRDLVVKVRNLRAEYSVDASRRIPVIAGGGAQATLIERHADIFSRLANVEKVTLLNGNGAPEQSAAVVSGDVTLYLPLAGMIDLAVESDRLSKELENIKAQITKTEGMLANESFVSRAKPEVVERERTKLKDLTQTRGVVEERLRALKG
jgi:valyl-tRNA synthetase